MFSTGFSRRQFILPTSQEYLATDQAHPFFGYHRVFAWNSFVLSALELAGLLRPEMDPDYSIA